MRKIASIIFALSILLSSLTFSAAEEGTKGTGDKTYYDEVVRILGVLSDTYEREDISSFMNKVSKDYDGDYLALEEDVTNEFDKYDNFTINIKVDRVSSSEDKGLVFADTHWDKRRVGVDEGKESVSHGTTQFIFKKDPEGKFLLNGMTGRAVFGEH
ncbi:MAG: hypothetical protein JW984_03400 [Deltaproteobacteria bacterium]|uniref:DUF5104 domain-containing protein n=1 Tax=Candidatus Zymogenus saltonus TaxID=2844893 RepID=A0A9D8KAX8_9DELT|nr:hypothetical protein [Candidatus Zymogenus saltonus]